MKILRLTGSAPERWGIELHPRLTVVHGLSPALSAAVRDALDAVVQGRISGPELAAAGLGGSVSIGDEEVSLDDLADQAPGLVASIPMTAADLVSSSALLAGDRRRLLADAIARAESDLAEAEAALVTARHDWEVASEARTTRLRAGWLERQEAVGALHGARTRAADAAAESRVAADPGPGPRGGTPELVSLAAARLDAARAARDAARVALVEAEQIAARPVTAAAGVEIEALRQELADAEAAAVAPEPAVATPEQRDALVRQRALLMEQIAAVSGPSPDRVIATLTAAEAHRGIEAVEAGRVAVEWERVREQVAAETASAAGASPLFEASVEAPAPSIFGGTGAAPPPVAPPALVEKVAVARERVVAAHHELESVLGSGPLEASEVEALEAAHAEVLAAWEGSERRIGVGKARRRLEDAQLAEREVLARMGFASYTEFMVSGRASGLPPQVEPELARREVMFAEEALRSAEAELEAAMAAEQAAPAPVAAPLAPVAPAPSHLVETLAALRARATELLGEDPGEDVAARLRERIATDPVSDLRLALDEVGVPLGEVMSRDEVLARARAWIARQDDTAHEAAAAAAQRVQVEDALARCDAAEGAHVAWEAAQRRRDHLRAAVAEAEAVVGTDASAEERVARDRADLERAEAEVADAERALAATSDGSLAPAPASPPLGGPAVDVDLPLLEAEARDAQTALDVAVSRLLPVGDSDAETAADARLGAAEARAAVARIELDALRAVAADHRRSGGEPSSGTDLDSAIWRVLSRLASQQEAARGAGPGPTPLLLVEPFEGLADTEVRRLADALVGPAAAVQTIVMTARPDVATWARGLDGALVGVVGSAQPEAFGPS